MSDTPGYGFINPNHIDNLTKELAEAKERIEELEAEITRRHEECNGFLKQKNETIDRLDAEIEKLEAENARLYKEGCPLANSDARWIERLLERMEG